MTLLCLVGLLAGGGSGGGSIDAELSRLEGHTVEVAADRSSFRIVNIAGDGEPAVGVVERRGEALVLQTGSKSFELTGPLAVPRIAGPGYKVWVIGEPTADGGSIAVRRIGILALPQR